MSVDKLRIIGIDPGSIFCGYGVVERDSRKNLIHVSSGTIKLPRNEPLQNRLMSLHNEMRAILKEFSPEMASVEKVIFAKGIKAALHLGQARGIVLLSLAEEGISFKEYSPNEIKMAVVGYGKAEKKQVQEMVRRVLSLRRLPSTDSADALALAVCHLNALSGYG